MSGRAAERRTHVRWAVAVALAAAWAFFPALQNGFVEWDDDVNFLDNPHYRGLGPAQLKWMWTAIHSGHYIPLSWMTSGLDYALWGMDPRGYHLTSLVLHALNAVLFYFLALRLYRLAAPDVQAGREAGFAFPAAVAALLFAVHPLRVESVAWATERRDVLSGFFFLSSVLAYLRYARDRGRGAYAASLFLFAGALLSKETCATLPAALLILDVYPLRRLGGARGWFGPDARRVWLEKAPFFALAAAAGAVLVLGTAKVESLRDFEGYDLGSRLVEAAYGVGFYAAKTIWPLNLSPVYQAAFKYPYADARFLLSEGLLVVLTAALIWRRRVWPAALAAWAYFLVTLSPVLRIAENVSVANDRYTYLPSLSPALLAGYAAWRIFRAPAPGARDLRPVAAFLGFVLLLALGTLTRKQAAVWRDSETLWTQAVAVDPRAWLAHYNLGHVLKSKGDVPGAMESYREAVRLRPHFAAAHLNLGNLYFQAGQKERALEHYRQAARHEPGLPEAAYAVGVALAHLGKFEEAEAQLRRAIELKPDHAGAHLDLGVALIRQGKEAEAEAAVRKSLALDPANAPAHYTLGFVLERRGRSAEAAERYGEALRLDPSHAPAKAALARAARRR